MVWEALFLNLKVLTALKQKTEVRRASNTKALRMVGLDLITMIYQRIIDQAFQNPINSIIFNQIVMISTPGLFKFFWPKDNVQTKYVSLFDIPVIDINKRFVKLESPADKPFYLLHINSVTQNVEAIKTIQQRLKGKIYIIPDQNGPQNFQQIKKVYPNALGKMIFNGADAHPLAKYLRKNTRLYNFQMFGAEKTIPFGIFKIQKEHIKYYSGQKLTQFVNQLENAQ